MVARTVEFVKDTVSLDWAVSQFSHGDAYTANVLLAASGVFPRQVKIYEEYTGRQV